MSKGGVHTLHAMACNLTDDDSNRRMRNGVIMFAVSLAIGVIMVQTGINPLYRLLLILPFWAAANAFTSALYKT